MAQCSIEVYLHITVVAPGTVSWYHAKHLDVHYQHIPLVISYVCAARKLSQHSTCVHVALSVQLSLDVKDLDSTCELCIAQAILT